jgi:hypothetical protein
MELTEKTFENDVKYYFKNHERNLNDNLIDKMRCMIENDFLKRYWYKQNKIDFDFLVEKTSEEVGEMTSFWVLSELTEQQKKGITDLIIAKKNVKELLESPMSLIDFHGLEYWWGVVERRREELRKLF